LVVLLRNFHNEATALEVIESQTDGMQDIIFLRLRTWNQASQLRCRCRLRIIFHLQLSWSLFTLQPECP